MLVVLLMLAVLAVSVVPLVPLGRRLDRDDSVTRGFSDVRVLLAVLACLSVLAVLCLFRIVCAVGLIVCLYDSGGTRCAGFTDAALAGATFNGAPPTGAAFAPFTGPEPADGLLTTAVAMLLPVDVEGIADCLRGIELIVFRGLRGGPFI